MDDSIRIALCQINPLVGDFDGNRAKIVDAYRQASDQGARVAVFPELALSGFPPQDLLLRNDFIATSEAQLAMLVTELDRDCTAVVGVPLWALRSVFGYDAQVVDAVAVIRSGELELVTTKLDLSMDSALDDFRYFAPDVALLEGFDSVRTGSEFEVDGWSFVVLVGVASHDSIIERVRDGRPTIVLNPTATAYHTHSQGERELYACEIHNDPDMSVVVVNGVGAQDELIFDGGSVVANGRGIAHRSARFEETVDVVEIVSRSNASGGRRILEVAGADPDTLRFSEGLGDLWSALVLGIRDYVAKNGFPGILLGLSGGVDSALVATLAADAIGPERVHAVLMPSRHSSDHSVDDANELAGNLGIDARTIPIEPAHKAFEQMLSPSFEGLAPDLTEENLQARVRGTTLMALSNKFGWLVLVTGNKSESSVGYSTLYGDTAGGLAPIQDVDKTTVYELCRWYNQRCESEGSAATIPVGIITKAPSAELRPGQRDDQSLPPYPLLDPMLKSIVEDEVTRDDLLRFGYQAELVDRILGLVKRSEYKRRQSPPGLIVTERSPGFRRSLPITRR